MGAFRPCPCRPFHPYHPCHPYRLEDRRLKRNGVKQNKVRILLEEKVDLLLFETFSSTLEAIEAVRAARELSKEIPVLASMTFLADGKTTFRVVALKRTEIERDVRARSRDDGAHAARARTPRTRLRLVLLCMTPSRASASSVRRVSPSTR